MRTRTLLEICNNIAVQLRFATFTEVIGNDDKNAVTILLAVRQGMFRDVMKHHPWSILRREYSVAFAANRNYYVLPANFSHVVNDTSWDLQRNEPALGPLGSTQWMMLKNIEEASSRPVSFTIKGWEPGSSPGAPDTGKYQLAVYIYPTPSVNSSGRALTFEYISDRVVSAANGSPKTDFATDNDSPVLDPDLVEHAGYVRALRLLGLRFDDEAEELAASLKTLSRRDGGALRMSASGHSLNRRDNLNIPGHVLPPRRY